jgi:uncharacterized membrane protein YgcG
LSPAAAARLDGTLRDFEGRAGAQIVVSIFPALPSPSLEDFTVRTAQAWRVGRKGLDNGAILFVFVKERRLRIEVGYGLEDKIPDVIAKRILDEVVAPELKAGRPEAGLEAGIQALMAAAEGRPIPTPGGGTSGGDVPILEATGVSDQAGLIPAEREKELAGRLERLTSESGCRLALVTLPGPPERFSSYQDPHLFATRAFFRTRPRPGGADDARYFRSLDADPSAVLIAFVYSRKPLQAAFGFFGSCLGESIGRAIVDHEIAPRFAADPAGALESGLEVIERARRGEYAPPTPAPTPEPPPLTRVDRAVSVVSAIAGLRLLGLPIGSIGLLAAGLAIVTLPVRALAIRRRMQHGQGFFPAYGMEMLMVLGWFARTAGTTYSSSGSSSSSGGFSGGGGRFGGGGASGSW